MNITDDMRNAACASMGTKQCAAICLSYSPRDDPCPAYHAVWTEEAIQAELKRRPDGPLLKFRKEITG